MKKFFFFLLSLFLLASCQKEAQHENANFEPEIFVSKYQAMNHDASVKFADPMDGNLIFTESEFRMICDTEDHYLNVFTDDELRSILPVGAENKMPYDAKLRFLREKLSPSGRITEGETVETYSIRQSGPARWDATNDIVAQVMAASGTIVGVNSSLNMWRPINDNGQVTAFDITRAISGVNQAHALDTAVEYDPESVVFEFQVSGGNWLISADIISTDFAGQSTIIHYGMDSPNGPLIWNPTLASPADDDLIQGPLPGGILSIAANGLTPPAPID